MNNNKSLSRSQVDKILSNLNISMIKNPPTSDLTLDLSGGTNASPTGGLNNSDLVNLRDIIFPISGGFLCKVKINPESECSGYYKSGDIYERDHIMRDQQDDLMSLF